MSNKKYFSVSEFAKFSRTTQETLRHYDRIGLLSPISRGNNKYRYYDGRQISTINMIRTFQTFGMSLEEIKTLRDDQSHESLNELFESQLDRIDSKIDEWVRARKLLFALQKSLHSVLNSNEKEITIQYVPAEAIILGDLNDYSRGRNDYDALFSFYNEMSKKYPDLDMNYPVWGCFSEERIKKGDWVWPDRYYFYNPEGHDRRPAALYAVGYTRGGYGHSDELYQRILKYVDINGFEVCGDAYEEYPLNEISIAEDNNYLMRVMVTVQNKVEKVQRRKAFGASF
ncbi:MAG: MerR family transcriptional regulator [Dehalococcoidia bacterium]|nr:MerR family transcriptional regulator [Dehalococcoidia bacterium]